MTWIAPTNYGMPYALIRRSGDTAGKRPSTRMAFITKAVAENGRIVLFKGYIANNKMERWTKSQRPIEPDDIIKTWRDRPLTKTIQTIKRRMPKVAEDSSDD